jgi:hypothetical protein
MQFIIRHRRKMILFKYINHTFAAFYFYVTMVVKKMLFSKENIRTR